ncbi:alginate export family protein [Rhodothermus profundi]|uniref:Alginate export n=1 Tax=Rhodothermus profundi TaxID=633813 RepID=A0A1M6Q177_9BACT|nr:alginate export family protein [Rhodothermus profundi]SHK13989.1 Alginate export [Rhodothermus profundi]
MKAMQHLMILLLGVSGGWGGAALANAPADTLRAQGAWGHLLLNARYRYELVDETGKETAHASTLRLRMGYGTPALKGLRMYVEVEGLQAVGADRYNSLRNGKVRYATVADPEKAELNQLWLDVLLVPKTRLRVGRQRLTYDNHRFIGNVGWRQLEQTYDAVSLTSRLLPAWILEGAYLWRVQNVLSRQQRLAAPLLHLVYTGWRAARVVVYGYWISFEEQASASRSVQTYGIRLSGSRPVGDQLTLRYTGEYAYQMDYRDNPNDFAVQYVHAMLGLSVRQHGWVVTASGALELFTSDRGVAFSTPLATLHAFQGWADRFLRTPPQGLRDLYVSLSLRRGRVQATGIYHDFASDDGQLAYGRELDLVARYVVSPNLSLLVKYAAYQARSWSVDVQKYWFMLTFGF